MEIRNRLFPYPVLSEDTDDYREEKFEVIPEILDITDSDICLQFNIEIEDARLRTLINEDKAEYVIHLECSSTCFRTIIRTPDTVFRYKLAQKQVNKKVELLGMLVAKEDIYCFSSVALNRDYDDIDVNFKKGSILAYHNMAPLDISKKYEELSTNESIFRVCRYKTNSMEHNPIRYNLTDERILITMDDDAYAVFAPMKDRQSMNALVKSSVLLPALTYAFEMLKYGNRDDYRGQAWYIQLDKHYKTLGKTLEDELDYGGEPISILAQKLLDNPINDLFVNLKPMLEG